MPEEIKKDRDPDTSEYDETALQSEDEMKGGAKVDGPYLILVQGPHQGFKFPMVSGDNTIGRIMGSEVLLEDHSVSRRHAVVTWSSEGWTVTDCGSKNGTFVNGQKISEKVTIGHGDVVHAGIYALRLVTKPMSKDEEIKPPPDWEGRTLMTATRIRPDEETATLAEAERKKKEAEEKKEGEEEKPIDERGTELEIPQEIQEEGSEAKVSPRRKFLMLIVLILLVIGATAYVYFKFIYKGSRPGAPVKTPAASAEETPAVGAPQDAAPQQQGAQQPAGAQPTEGTAPAVPPQPPKLEVSATVPVFLDFASSPLPAAVSFQGQDYGMTPVKVQAKLDVDKPYSADAVFEFKEIGEKYKLTVPFTVKRDEPLIPILFKGPIGAFKLMELPRDTQLYIEGYFIYDPFNARTAKLENVVFGKPVYVPYGKYVVELRREKELAGSGEFTQAIRYRREILISEDSPIFALKISDSDLNEFPVEVVSVPVGADVFIDAQKVGVTPYKGIFPLGEHSLSLRKDGYFEHKQDLKMDANIPVKMEIAMKTTAAGEFVNAGKLLMQKSLYKEAIEKMTEVFKNNPSDGEIAQARYLIGSCFVHLNDLGTAESYFKQSVENADMKYPSMLGLVSVYYGQGRKEEAIPAIVEVMLNAKDEEIKREATTLFRQISPLKSIIYIYSNPDGARVYLNDKLIGMVTPLILPELSLGNYRVRIEKDGFMPQDLNINLSINEFNPVIVDLKPLPE